LSGQSTVRKVYTERSRSGFTLIELLITISIISILSVIGIVVYSSVIKQGQDSKRQSDLRSIQSALEQYHNDQGFYPTAISSGSPLPRPSGGMAYMNIIPTDPLNDSTRDYTYQYQKSPPTCDNSAINRCTSYCLYAKLEGSNPTVGSCAASGTRNFAVTPP